MTIPTSKSSFKEYCLRKLGKPVIEINISEEQVDDRVDEALRRFMDFHFEGSERTFYKYQMQPNNKSTAIYGLTLISGGQNYSNTDPLVFSGGGGTAANGSILTNANGIITSVSFSDNGMGYAIAPTISVPSSNGTGASITAELGGFIPVPENIIGIINLFEVGSQAGASNLFNLRYQIVLNDLYMFNNLNIVPYTFAMYNVALIHEILVGKQPIRYQRYLDKLYIDMDWSALNVGDWIIAECYKVVDPEVYTNVWSDTWLQRYCTALIKEQWGEHLSKFANMPMVGGMMFNGVDIKREAKEEKLALEDELISTYSLPAMDFIA